MTAQLRRTAKRSELLQERYLVIAQVARRVRQRRIRERFAEIGFLNIDDTAWEPPRFSLDLFE